MWESMPWIQKIFFFFFLGYSLPAKWSNKTASEKKNINETF